MKKEKILDDIRKELFSLQDEEYRLFQSKLMPTVPIETVIGVRTPSLRKYASELYRNRAATEAFLCSLPHYYYEENNLHAFLIEKEKDFGKVIFLLDEFLPYVDNWATCDSMSPKVLKKHTDRLMPHIYKWIDSPHTYTVRYAIGLLMKYYLDESFKAEYPDRVAAVVSSEYYIKMMVSWYFATALAKQYESILPYLTENRLGVWEHNMTIKKACESFRISDERKDELRKLKQ